jgi:iron complex outermembrane receptor protein
MTRSRKRKLRRLQAALASVPLASTALIFASPSLAQQEAPESGLAEVTVTAQKRTENLQNVPLSITALGTEQLSELQVTDFTDYAKFLPSVAYQSIGPGATSVYMRGVASGENSNHSGPQPSVGIYLDEQPITTIQGALDVHVYDIARVESLAGPQGTLYGASSQAGTIRIITNKPDPSAFAGGYDLQLDTVANGDPGYLAEGFVNVPISERAAVRLVGWARHDGGYIDNVLGSRTYPTWDEATGGNGTITNEGRAKDNYNEVDTYGARAALRVELNDNWTLTPQIMAQKQDSDGSFGYDSTIGELKVTHFKPEYAKDEWAQAALTLEGRIANLDLVYAGAYLKRDIDSSFDYSDYSFFYDVNYGYGAYWYDDDGAIIDPTQYFEGMDKFKKYSNELRVSSSLADDRFRWVLGLFQQRQEHGIEQRYKIDGLAVALNPTGWPDTIWLTQQERVDRDKAVFGEATYDFTDKLSGTAGIRFFEADNSLVGFFGYGLGYSPSGSGEAQCDPDPANWVQFNGAPCINLDKNVKEDGDTKKLNLSYKLGDQKLVYATWSEGFRPGGINRRGTLPPYVADFLTNYEIGFKSTWAGNRLRFNAAAFVLDWEDIQFSYLGANGLTEIKNANQARVKGVEADMLWAATDQLTLSLGFAVLDPELSENYCGTTDDDGNPITDCDSPAAPEGTQLPVSAKLKTNITARYEFPFGNYQAHVQGALVTNGRVWSDLQVGDRAVMGTQPSYSLTDLSAGVRRDRFNVELFIHNAFDERAQAFRSTQCGILGPAGNPLCGNEPYIYPVVPRTIGLRFGQKF